MKGDFLTVCHSCGDEHRTDTFNEANEFYLDHHEQGHTVETLNLAAMECDDLIRRE